MHRLRHRSIQEEPQHLYASYLARIAITSNQNQSNVVLRRFGAYVIVAMTSVSLPCARWRLFDCIQQMDGVIVGINEISVTRQKQSAFCGEVHVAQLVHDDSRRA
jgi:hypothetical protein